ncbi:hypothetical protein VTN00DRAFT_7991 [Thermoascus crustaceus]|uniref:uncharacterized protein n=1 Tax=Thermoascus crustaceus TaxID=5088 RepID=UPI0037420512
MKKPQNRLRSICLARDKEDHSLVAPADTDPAVRQQLRDVYQSNLVKWCPAFEWSGNSHLAACPHPVLVTEHHTRQLVELHEALVLAITDIVERWWSDTKARFPERMPLEPQEEELLRWIDTQGPNIFRPFKDCSGSWRPDFLLEQDSDSDNPDKIENFRVCEINARFCWNGYMLVALGQQALLDGGVGRNGLRGATDPEKIIEGLRRLYKPDLPLHLLKGEERGIDIHLFTSYAERQLGIRPRFITPSDLRLMPSPHSNGGYKLCCLAPQSPKSPTQLPTFTNSAGEVLEEIHQVGLELHQRELLALSREMLQQISLRCFNDMRTVLLVHDKRMLGIVLQELESLVEKNILTPEQAKALQKGIATTILPGSVELEKLITACHECEPLKNDYILKPVRSGKGAGILFGDQLNQAEWISKLDLLRCPGLAPGTTTYVIQRRVQQPLYDVLMREIDGLQQWPIIGTYHVIHGQFLGFGVWRSSPGRVCAISHGGAWMCSVMGQD